EAKQRNICRNIAKLGPQDLLQILLDICKALSADQDRTSLGQANAALPIHRAEQSLRNTSPEIDRQTVARSDHIIRSCGKVHRNQLRISSPIFEQFRTESRRGLRA